MQKIRSFLVERGGGARLQFYASFCASPNTTIIAIDYQAFTGLY